MTMTKTNKLILILLGVGLFSLVLSLLIASQTENGQAEKQTALATVQSHLGDVFVLRKNLTKKEVITGRTSLYALDSVETSPEGDASLEFPSADRIHIEEDSWVTLSEESGRTVVLIKRGDIQVESYGSGDTLLISRDGRRWTPRDYEVNYKRQASEGTLPDLPPSVETPDAGATTQTKTPTTGLTPEYIQDTLRLHRGSFFKCYTQLLQRTPGVTGQASLSFSISSMGKVGQAEVISSTLTDPQFKKCLVDVISRVDFKSFEGDPISTVFPLRFE